MERDDPSVSELVAAAAAGDEEAWGGIVDRFTPLVVAIAARHRLRDADIPDVAQATWVQLVEHLDELREPRALPGWIATTARNECIRVVRRTRRATPFDPGAESCVDGLVGRAVAREHVEVDVDDGLLRDERHEALLSAFADLSDRQRELVLLLLGDPPLSYADISVRLGMPIGAIGPTRARVIARLRQHPAIAALRQPTECRSPATIGDGGERDGSP